MLESQIESRLVQAVKAKGGLAIKLNPMSLAGIPDRLVLLPGGRIVFVELKAPGKKPRRVQEVRHNQLRSLGFEVLVIDSVEMIIREICTT